MLNQVITEVTKQYMPNDETDNSPGMLFDSVFKTATQKAGHLLVAVIEQMFHVKAEYDRIYTELKDCYDRFLKACETKVLSEDDTRNLAELSRIVLNYVTRKLDPDLKGRMVTLLGGQIIELRQDIWFKDGFRQGEKKYERNHIADMLRRGKTPEEIADFCAYPIDLVKEIQEELLSKVK